MKACAGSERCSSIRGRRPRPPPRAHALRSFGSATGLGGDFPASERLCEQSLALFQELGDEHGCAVILHRLSLCAMVIRGDLDRARELVDASHELHARNDDWWQRTFGHAQTIGTRAAIARDSGDDAVARGLLEESAELARSAGAPWWQGGMLGELAALALREGQVDAAERYARESLAIAADLRDRTGRVFGVGLLACVAAERGQLERAGRLSERSRTSGPSAPLGGWQRHRDERYARILELATPGFDAAVAAGRKLELDEAIAYALEQT